MKHDLTIFPGRYVAAILFEEHECLQGYPNEKILRHIHCKI